jgi:hypothetical protein
MNFLNLIKSSDADFYTIRATEDSVLNGTNLLNKYNSLSLNLGSSNRFTIYLEPGIYDLKTSSLILNKNFIDIVGLHPTNKSVITSNMSTPSNGTINQLVDNIKLVNLNIVNSNSNYIYPYLAYNNILTQYELNYYQNLLSTVPSCYFRNIPNGQSYGDTYLNNITFTSNNISILTMRAGTEYNGTYIDCQAGNYSFGFNGKANGTYINCTAGFLSFGSLASEVNGYFENCTAIGESFGSDATYVAGRFKNCTSQNNSFGAGSTQNLGQYINCKTEIF